MSFKELNISNPGTSTKYGGNDTDLLNKLFNGVVAGIPAVRIRSQNKFGFDDGILWIYNQALSKKTTIRGQSNAPATDVDLRLPPITGNDVLTALGITNTFSVKQQFNAGVLLQEMDEPVSTTGILHQLYVDSATKHLTRKNSLGEVTDYDAVSGGSGTGGLGSYTFLIQKIGSTYYAKDAFGAIVSSNADCGVLLNTIRASLSDGDVVEFIAGETYSGSTQYLHTGKKRIQFIGNGAIISGFKFKIDGQSDTSSVGKCVFRNFEFNGPNSGVILDNVHMTDFEYCFFNNNTVGLSLESSVKWTENTGVLFTNFQDCGISILFKAPTGSGTGSYINSSLFHCTFNNTAVNPGPFTYIKSESNTQLDEGKWLNNRLWFNGAANCTGMDFGGSCSRLMLFKPYFENFSGSTGTTGIILQSTVTGSPFLMGRPTFASSGTWTGKFINASNKSIHGPVATWRQTHTITPSVTIDTYGTVVNCLTSEDWAGIPNMYVIIGGTVAAGETVSVDITKMTYSASNPNITKTYTATGTYPLTLADYQALLTSNYYTVVESIDVKAKSSIATTAATVTFIGFAGGTAVTHDSLSPNTTLGDLTYRTATTNARLAGNITAVRQFLAQTGNGTISAAPAWVTPKSIVHFNCILATSTNSNFMMLIGGSTGTTTEANNDIVYDYAFTVKRVRVVASANTKNADTLVSFRDDGVDIPGTPVTVTASVVGEFDSGALSTAVAAGSKINFRIDTSGSASGTLTCIVIAEVEISLQ